ncbi:hypothetical protein KC345_g5381 [Hortaea werneckii]|nr:hypothetical protein KC345_g5381 [Hortaea werneckii]
MEQPPAYTPSPRSIEGLRAQILANGSLLRPKSDPHHSGRSSGDHIELVLAKLTAPPAATKLGASAATASGPPTADKHYALLVQRTYSKKDVGIILKGKPRDSVEEALQWILERTETQIHEMVSRYGRTSSGDGCCVM